MLARVLTAMVLTQEATPRLVLEQRLSALDAQAARARTLQTLGIVTLVGVGVSREVRNVFAAVQHFETYRALTGDPSGDRGYRQMQDAIVVAWVVTAALAAATTLFFVIGFASEPSDERARVVDQLQSLR
ncbi:MAG: hypothetical protein JNM69_10125 [Archangium sp.]|nr:hypothetical protein [Archangium sp.]